jgi:hypothetical protein
VQARVAVAAGLGQVLAEIAQEGLAAAARCFAVAQQGRQLVLLEPLVALAGLAVAVKPGGLGVVHGHQAAQHGDVGQAVGHPGHGRQPVAAGAARLLVIGLQARGRVQMGHEAHVGLVHAHAEGHGGDHDHALLAHEPLLVGLARGRAEARVIRQGRKTLPGQELGRGLDLLARHAVDDARLPLGSRTQEGQELPLGAVLELHEVADVRPVEARGEDPRRPQAQLADDVGPRQVVGRGRQGQARHAGEKLGQLAEPGVLGAEVVPPLGHAVGLVDGEERQGDLRQALQKARHEQPFGRYVEQIEPPGPEALFDVPRLGGGQGGIEERGAHAVLGQGLDLVAHEGDEGRDHQGRARADQGRDLVAQGLAAARGHKHHGVAAGQHCLDDGFLGAYEAVVAEDRTQCLKGGWHGNPLWGGWNCTRTTGCAKPLSKRAGRTPQRCR